MFKLQAQTDLWVVPVEQPLFPLMRFLSHLLLRLCSRLCGGPVSEHPAHYRGASISHPVQSRVASPGERTSPSPFVTLWTPVAVPNELWLTRLVGSWYPWPWPANWCCQARRQPHRLPHSERPWAQLHGCPAQLQPNKSCAAAIPHIHPASKPSVPGHQFSVDRLSATSTCPERHRALWGCTQSRTSLRGGRDQGEAGGELEPSSSTSYSHRSGGEACFWGKGQWEADGGGTNQTPHTQLLREETQEGQQEEPQGG